jgi:hypothetical protein
MPTDAGDRWVRKEWQELGFFYDRNDQQKVWRLIGSRSGLLRFRDALLEYAEDPSNDYKSEHSHYGPYRYLEIMTWPEPGFDNQAIRGSLPELKRLATIVETSLAITRPGGAIYIRDEFASDSPYALILEVREDGFDPSQADPMLPREGSA